MRTPLMLNIALSVLVFFGFFTLYVWGGMLLQCTFNDFMSFLILPFLLSVVFLLYLFKQPVDWSAMDEGHSILERASVAEPFQVRWVLLSLLSAGLLLSSLIPVFLNNDEAFVYSWLLLSAGLAAMFCCFKAPKVFLFGSAHVGINGRGVNSYIESVLLIVFGAVLVGLYTLSLNNNADDTHFVSYIAGLLHYPDRVMFEVDAIFKQGQGNYIFSLNYGQSWEALSATFSRLTSVNHLDLYYFYLPSVFLLVTPVPLYYFVKIYFPRYAFSALVFSFVVIFSWSTYNSMQGFFFIPRFYQGKAIFISFILPFLMLIARRFFIHPDLRFGLLCLLCLVASAGATSSGLYISLILLGICFLAYTPVSWYKLFRNGLFAILMMLPNLVMLGVVKEEISAVEKVATEVIRSQPIVALPDQFIHENMAKEIARPINSMYWLFGDNKYLGIYLMLFIATYVMLFLYKDSWRILELKRLYLVIGVLGFAHPLASVLTDAVGPGNLVWRYHWALPMSLIFALFPAVFLTLAPGIASVDGVPKSFKTHFFHKLIPPVAFAVVALLGLGFLLLSANHLRTVYGNQANFYKLNPGAYQAAVTATRGVTKQDTILANTLVAEVIPMLRHSANLLASRPLYWDKPYFDPAELSERKHLQYLIDNLSHLNNRDVALLIDLIQKREITVFIYEEFDSAIKGSVDVSISLTPDFDCSEKVKPWVICRRVD